MPYSMILVTCDDESFAQELGEGLVREKLAACVQIHPVQSIYSWENQIHNKVEFRLIIKTRDDLYERVEAFVTDYHPYEVPQIIKVPIENGLPGFLSWIEESTSD